MMVDKCFVQVFYHVPIQDILQYMEEQVEKTSVVDPIIFPFRQMLWTITSYRWVRPMWTINDVFRGHSPHLFWLVLHHDECY